MEKLINNRLIWYLEKYQILSNMQTGFRRGRNTVDQIVKLQDAIIRQQQNKGHLLAVFVDFEKAFDMVWKMDFSLNLNGLELTAECLNGSLIFHQSYIPGQSRSCPLECILLRKWNFARLKYITRNVHHND